MVLFRSLQALERGMIFFPERLPEDFRFVTLEEEAGEEVFLTTADGVRIHGLFYPGSDSLALLYFHGNAGSLRDWQFVWEELRELSCSLFILDYRGYGKSSGKITEEGIYEDAKAAYHWLVERGFPQERILLYGRSLGSAPALYLAERFRPRALILETPFSSLKDLARYHYPFLPPGLPLFFSMDNLSRAKNLEIPVLILHGDQDEIVPLTQARRLYAHFSGEKEFVVIPGGHHNDLSFFPAHRAALKAFVERIYKRGG